MSTSTQTPSFSHRWLDFLAVGMAALCAVHCLLTPLLLILLPVLAASFWTRPDFHFWMIMLVLPTTVIAMALGFRRHKDKMVLITAAAGLGLLAGSVVQESLAGGCAECAGCVATTGPSLPAGSTVVNVLGGLLLAGAHIRNFALCRKLPCPHAQNA